MEIINLGQNIQNIENIGASLEGNFGLANLFA
jgi:hypothetical protein